MPDIIHLLPDSVANQIAAGEVIQRPASVIKELVENSVDAGATDISITVADAGRTLIQVSDDGKGMSPTDARMAFERHATSKISAAADLFTLSTMGFRGEALPSICAISHVELLSATDSDEMGTKLVIVGSKVELQEAAYCRKGTTISVKNLFFNVPARRRFLKSDNVELANVQREFERLALVNNNVRFRFDSGSRKRDLRAASFKQRIADLWKGSLNIELLPVEIDTDIVKITGYISRPEHARRRNPLQYLIVNGRNMRHPKFARAIMNCYDKLIAPDTQPNFFLKFEVDPASIDVNIHPTKNEIKFENEQEIWSLLTSAVKAALGKFSAVPGIDFETGAIDIDPLRESSVADTSTDPLSASYNPFEQASDSFFHPNSNSSGGYHPSFPSKTSHREYSNQRNWNSLYVDFMNQTDDENVANQEDSIFPKSEDAEVSPSVPTSPMCIQVDNKYIVTHMGNGVMIIDQHRAHVKILYEELMNRMPENRVPLQGVMFGEEIFLDEAQTIIYEDIKSELASMGITLLPQDNKWVIATLPPMMSGRDGREVVLAVIDSMNDMAVSYGETVPSRCDLKARIALSLAKSAAIERGRTLTEEEMEHLISRLFCLPSPSASPDGKPIMCVIGSDKLESFFR